MGGSFLGRRREMTALLAALEDARSGRGRLVLIGGEPGIGKSRLADEVAAHARDVGVTVLLGKCWEAGGAPAYWPWIQCLRSLIRATDPTALRELMGTGAADIAQVLPEIETLIPDLPPRPSVDREAARFRLFDATTALLRNAGAARPLMVVIDDLQAADTASLLLLRFLAGQLTDMRVLLLATYRDVDLTPDHPLTVSIVDLAREPTTHHLVLGGLRRADVALLIERLGEVAPPTTLVSTLHRQTGGNPLFVGEAIRLLAVEGSSSVPREPVALRSAVPEAVREVILRRLAHLSEPCRRMLRLASVLGPELSTEALRRLGDLPADELAEVVDEGVAAGLLVEIGGGLGRFRFFHGLVREVLYEEIPPGQRARIHLTAGEVLAQLYATDLDPHLGVIAHHYFEGAPAGSPAKAAEYARRAADHAARQLAYEETVRLYQMALQATELEEPSDSVVQCDLLLRLGDAQMRAGDTAGAKETFLGAAGIARRLGMPEDFARAALGYGGRFVWARAANDRHLVPLLTDALTAVGEEDTILRSRLLARLSGALRDQPGLEARDAHSEEAVDIARRLGDPATLAYALDGRYSAIWAPDTADERLQIADEIVDIAEAIGDSERAIQGRHYRHAVFLERGDVQTIRAELEVNARLADELRQPAQQWYARATAATLALLEGRFEDAERLNVEAFELGRHAEAIFAVGVELLQTYSLRREQGRAAEMESAFREVLDEYSFWPWMRVALLHLYSELDRRAEVRSLFEAVASQNFSDLPWDNDWLMGTSLLAEVAARLRDRERSAALYELIHPYADRNGFGHPEFCTGSMSRPLGLLAEVIGNAGDAERHLEDAIAMNERMGARPWTAHSQHDLARVLAARDGPGDRERAAQLLEAARATARELGMVALEARISLASVETPLPAETPDGAQRPGSFRREGEYWSITFEGAAIRLRDIKGLRHLARLLEAPGREFHALDLVRLEEGSAAPTPRPEPGLEADGLGDAGNVLDPQAKAAYRQRLADLQEELDEAESWNDPERADRARQEIEFLTAELAGGVGLGGRDRRAASAAERARLNVTRAIRSAMTRIAEHHPQLGAHLDATIKTGLYCSYTPDTRNPPAWNL